MRLISLKVAGIRGFNIEQTIGLDEDLIIVQGPNGQGKTSLVEALEYLFFGEIFKKEKALSKIEFKDTIKNVHFEGTPFAEAKILISEEEKTIRREYVNESSSKIYINGVEVEDFGSIRGNTSHKPIIYQHALKSFINTKPKDRYQEFMKLLGIEKLDEFIMLVQTKLNKFDSEKPENIKNAILFCEDIKTKSADLYKSIIVENETRIQTANKIKDLLEIEDFPNINETNFDDFLRKVLEMIELEKKRIFDTQILSQIINYEEVVIGRLFEEVKLKETIAFFSNPLNINTANEVDLLEKGLLLINEDSSVCPLCKEDTINEIKKEEIRETLKKLKKIKTDLKSNEEYLVKVKDNISKYNIELEKYKLLLLNEEILSKIESFGINLTIIRRVNKEINKNLKTIEKEYNEISNLIEDIIKQKDLENNFKKFINSNKIFNQLITELKGKIDNFKKKIIELKQILDAKISSTEEIQDRELLVKIIQDFKKFKLFRLNKNLESEFKQIIKSLKEHRDKIVSDLINSHKVKIIEWYDLLNPLEDIKISDIKCSGDKINFIASCFGIEKSAVPILSEAHLNCLGLSIHLSQSLVENNPFSFMLIDDPVQSMDTLHTDNFINNVIEKLLDAGSQVLIFSHLKSTVTDLILSRYSHKFPTMIEFYGYDKEGPKLTIKGSNNFEDYLTEARKIYNGNSEQRKMCANMIRQAVECYIKLYYKEKSSNPLPEDCKKAQFSVLDSKLLNRISIDTNERGKLRNISSKCDKGSHDDQKVEPPTSEELNSFIDILKGFYKKYITV